ncbi:hypothetical protein AB0451_14780 [Streptomyces sp. NPDC052000]|uniref:hypothetical protein n=1 Tax=Streptomyces sp. NPDC052000 TaxID=3155676 RepID=UPI00344F1D50
MTDEILAPGTEGVSGLALPLDTTDVPIEFGRRCIDRFLGSQECMPRVDQVARVRTVDQVDHGVQLVVLEVRLPEEADLPAEREHGGEGLRRLRGHVGDADLLGDALVVRQGRGLGRRLRLLVGHRYHPVPEDLSSVRCGFGLPSFSRCACSAS